HRDVPNAALDLAQPGLGDPQPRRASGLRHASRFTIAREQRPERTRTELLFEKFVERSRLHASTSSMVIVLPRRNRMPAPRAKARRTESRRVGAPQRGPIQRARAHPHRHDLSTLPTLARYLDAQEQP